MQSKAENISEYIATLPNNERETITQLDQLVRAALPSAAASMKYGMPTYEIQNRYLALNAQKQYFSLYVDPELLSQHRVKLKDLSVGKSCIRFKRLDQLPIRVLKTILKSYLDNPKTA